MRTLLLFLSLVFALPQAACSSPVEAGPYTFIRARQSIAPGFPLDLPGIALWMDASDASTIDDSTATPDVDSWTDKGPGGHVFVQGTASRKPHISTEINSLGTITFDGTDDFLKKASSTFTGTNGYVFVVFKTPNPIANGTFLSSSDQATNNHSFIWTYQNRNYEAQQIQTVTSGTSNAVISDVSDMVADTAYLVALATDGSTWSMRRNGANMATDVLVGANVGNWFGDISGVDNTIIGIWQRASGLLTPLDGIIGEMIVVDGEDLTAPLITTIEAELNAKWSIY